jgi:hypothetical protein
MMVCVLFLFPLKPLSALVFGSFSNQIEYSELFFLEKTRFYPRTLSGARIWK